MNTPMNLRTAALVTVVLLLSCTAWANSDLYIVVLDGAKSSKADLSDEEVAKLGGRVEYRARGQVVVRAPAAAVEALRTDPRVKYVQQAILGRPSESGAAEAPASVVRMGRRSLQPAPQGAPPVWMSGTYKYDGAGNIYAIGVTADGAGVTPHTYRYDKLSRLSEVRNSAGGGNADESFAYDVYGNMTQHVEGNVTTVIDVDAATNRLSRPWLNPNPYQYDAAGDLSAEPNAAYTYDALGMLRERDYGTQWPDYYIYTADDERIATVYQDTWTWSVRGFDGAVLRQFQSQTNSSVPWLWLEDYVYRGGLLVSGERMREEGGRREFHLDHLGTPRLVTGPGGAEMAHHDLEPYGTEAYPLWQETTAGFDREDPMRFTGHERDFRSGFLQTTTPYLDYMHARYYASTMGRFLSVDQDLEESAAMLDPQRWNRYSYALNNPYKYVDRDGRNVAIAVPVVLIALTAIVFYHEYEMSANPSYRTAMTQIGQSFWTHWSRQTGRQGDTGLSGLTDAEVQELYDKATGRDKLRYQKELKWRQQRNKGKSRGGGREPKKPPKGQDGGSNQTKLQFGGGTAGADGAELMEQFAFAHAIEIDDYETEFSPGFAQPPTLGIGLAVDMLLSQMNLLDSFWLSYELQKN